MDPSRQEWIDTECESNFQYNYSKMMQTLWLAQLQSVLHCDLRQKITNEINTLQTGFCMPFFCIDIKLDEFHPFQCLNFTDLHSFIFNSLNNEGATLIILY